MAKNNTKRLVEWKQAIASWLRRLAVFAISLKRKTVFRLLVLWLGSYFVLLSFFFTTILKSYAYIEIFPEELIVPASMHLVTAAIITLVIYWLPWLRSFAAKLMSVTVLSLLMVDYDGRLQAVAGPIRALAPGITDADPLPLVSAIYLIIIVILAVVVGMWFERVITKTERIRSADAGLGLLVLIGYLFLVPAFSVASIVPTMIRESRVTAPEFSGQKNESTNEEKPDIFYIVLDRYTNATVLDDQFGYDNSDFTGFLRDSGFRVNDNAYSNYPYTTMSISSTMNARYTSELVAPYKDNAVQSRTLYHNLIWQSSVAKALKKEGYKYYSIGSWYGATYKAPVADRTYNYEHVVTAFGHGKQLRGIEAIEFMKSPYYRFAQIPNAKWWPVKALDSDHIGGVRDQLNTLDDLATREQPGGRFIFAHILVPHDPFVFNGDGSLSANPSVDNVGKPIKDKYVGQVEFINSQMMELVAKIQKQSKGKAVIVLNADEGPYPQVLNGTFKVPSDPTVALDNGALKDEDMRQWNDDWLKMKFGILQAVHIPKATEDDLAHLSSVNIFRIVLNRYAGFNLEYLPECHYGISDGSQNEYNYADITARFVKNPDKRCEQLQSLPKE